MESITTKIELITPEIAAAFLEHNRDNRRMIKMRINQYSADMLNGHWNMSGDPIKFDVDGNMVDGQHRLMAVVDSGKTQEFLVIRGLNKQTKMTTDTGKPRTTAHILGFMEEKRCHALAASLRLAIFFERGVMNIGGSGVSVSPQDMVTFLNENPSIRDSVEYAVNSDLRILFKTSVLGFFLFYATMIDEDKAKQFFELLELPPQRRTHPCTVIKEHVMKARLKAKHSTVLPPKYLTALLIKAWNAFIHGKDICSIRYTANEKFPKMSGYDKY